MSSLTQNIEKKSIRRNKIFRKSLTKNLRRAFEIVQKAFDRKAFFYLNGISPILKMILQFRLRLIFSNFLIK
jgi:hypothetical protein